MSTRAIRILKQKKSLLKWSDMVMEKKGLGLRPMPPDFPLEATIKTLVVDLGAKHYTLVL